MPQTLSMYSAGPATFIQLLTSLSVILDKAIAHAEAKKIDSTVFVQARLAPDMLPLAKQVQIACDAAKFACARLSGLEAPKHEDNEVTLADLKARVTTVLDYVKTFKPEQVNGTEEKTVILKIRGADVPFAGLQYLMGFALPNFYFHVTTAYALLRHNGVDIGKNDFIGVPQK
jgi:uncharacterized protein